jgi:hypothetical protein
MVTVTNILTTSAGLLNDSAKAVYTDAVQLPYFNMALAELLEEMQRSGLSFNYSTNSVSTITAGITNIGGPGGPSLPMDLIEPINLYERDVDTDEDYLEMRKTTFLPSLTVLTSSLIWWTWQEQQIKFIGATTDRQIKIEYLRRGMQPVTDVNQVMPIINADTFLHFRTAALCAEFIMENTERANALNSNAALRLDTFISTKVKQTQSTPVRRRGFRSSIRNRSSW